MEIPKKIIVVLILFSLFFSVACSSKFEMSESERISNLTIFEFAQSVADKGLYPMGIGGGLNHATGKHKKFSITFGTEQKIEDLERARLLLVETIDAFIDFINSKDEIREYLDVFPVTIENVDVGIVRIDAQPQDIVSMSNCRDYLFYRAKNKDPEVIAWDNIHRETFEEAKAALSSNSYVK